MKLEVKYKFARINPFVPVSDKGKPPVWALISGEQLRHMKRELKSKMPEMHKNGGWVSCTIVDTDNETEMGDGLATCSLSDVFDPVKGKDLALTRAKIDVVSKLAKVGKRLEHQLDILK